jgi:hypothetical protein
MGSEIRKFFRELFGSRLIQSLELQLLQLRQDYERRLQDKDQVIADLRAEKAIMLGKMTIYENTIMPLASRAGAQVVAATNPTPKKPNFSTAEIMASLPKSRWEKLQDDYYKQQEEEAAKEKSADTSGTSADRS